MPNSSAASRRDEFEAFKRQINLSQYAASLGYQLDRKASSRNSAVLRHPGGDKVIVARGEDGHWIYFSVRDDRDQGTIIDFVQRRQASSLGEVRKYLRPWIGTTAPVQVPVEHYVAKLDHIAKDLIGVRRRYEAMQPIDGHHAYLEHERKIPWHILSDPLFVERIRVDKYKNAVFPHFNSEGLCGYELKNHGFTRFATGGMKGLWSSDPGSDDRRLVIAETAIDALSYCALKHQPQSRYLSTAGELNPDQPLLLQALMQALPPGGEVVLAVDHDAGGDKIGGKIESIFRMLGRDNLQLSYDRPITLGSDWNEELKAENVLHPVRPVQALKLSGRPRGYKP